MRKSSKKSTLKSKKGKRKSPLKKYQTAGLYGTGNSISLPTQTNNPYGGSNPTLDSYTSSQGNSYSYGAPAASGIGSKPYEGYQSPQELVAASPNTRGQGNRSGFGMVGGISNMASSIGRTAQAFIPEDNRVKEGQLTKEGVENYNQQQALTQGLNSAVSTALTTGLSAAGPYAAAVEAVNQALVKPIRKSTTHMEGIDGRPTEVPNAAGVGTMNAFFKPTHEYHIDTIGGWFDKDKSTEDQVVDSLLTFLVPGLGGQIKESIESENLAAGSQGRLDDWNRKNAVAANTGRSEGLGGEYIYRGQERVARTGGLRKYMGGGYTKVNGPSHENGGVPMDLDGDGVVESELEGGEGVEDMKTGGKYIWSDHLKTGGMSFAKKFEQERKRGATPRRIEKLRIEQELAAKRDPSKLYKKYGGMHKYQQGGKQADKERERLKKEFGEDYIRMYDGLRPYEQMLERSIGPSIERKRRAAQKAFERYDAFSERQTAKAGKYLSKGYDKFMDVVQGSPKETLSSDISEILQDETLSPDFIGRPNQEVLSSDISEAWQDDDLSPDFINKKKQARVYADMLRKRNPPLKKYQKDGLNQYRSGGKLPKEVLESKRDGGLMKYQGGGPKGFSMVQPKGTYSTPAPQKQRFVSPFATEAETRAFQDYANAQEAGVTNGYGWGRKSAYAYGEYGDQYAKSLAKGPANPFIKTNVTLPPEEAWWKTQVDRGDESATRPPQALLNAQYAKNQKGKKRQQNWKDLKGGFNEYAGAAAALLGAGARAAALGSIDPNERPPSMSARDVKAEKVFIDRARVNRGVLESELINAKRKIQGGTGDKTAALNAARMVSLRAQEEAEMDAYEQNRQASSTEQLAYQKAQLEADRLNQGKDLKTSESISRIMDKVIDTRRNQTIAGGEIFAQSMKDFQSWKANQDLTRAMEGDRNVMSNFYNNNYPAFARKFKKSNPNATALEINQAFLASV